MKIGLVNVDSTIPNLALMKISKYHKMRGDNVEFLFDFYSYDKVYMSKVFSYTPDYGYEIQSYNIEKGGTGYDIKKNLPDEIDRLQPDYSIYPDFDKDTAMGFLTRGCPNNCKWCVVPRKEGNIKPYMDIDDIMIDGRKKAILMDNNVLASEYGLSQIEKIINKDYKVDFNQALDARLVTPEIAKLLAKVKWIKRIRFGCDTKKQIGDCERAIDLIRGYGYKGEFFLYCILIEFEESYNRVNHWRRDKKCILHAQPYRDVNNARHIIPQWQIDMARWTDRKELFFKTSFVDYEPRKGFKCKEYFSEQGNIIFM